MLRLVLRHPKVLVAAFILILCFLSLAWSEEFQSPSSMICQSLDGKIVCQIVLDKSSSQWRLNHCIEQDGLCLEATITSNSDDDKTSQHLEAEYGDNDSKGASLADAFKKRMASQHEQGKDPRSLSKEALVLTVGAQTYEPPYDQYGSEVSRALKTLARQTTRKADDLDMAETLTLLGVAHRGEFGRGSLLTPMYVSDISDTDAEMAINAFLEALRLYEDRLPQLRQPMERDDVDIAIASLASVLADTYLLHSDEAQAAKAIEYYRLAESKLKPLVQGGARRLDALTYEEVELRWADAASHVAVLEINKIQKASMDTQDITMASTAQLPNLDDVLHDVKEGKSFLEEAVKVYRIASKRSEKKDPDQALQHKQALANTLHSAGTASVLLAQNEEAAKEWEEALHLFRQMATYGEPLEQDDRKYLVAEMLFSLSDVYLQMGMYDETNERYEEAMKLFSHQGAPPEVATVQMTALDTGEVLEMHEQSLREYHESLYGEGEVHVPDDYRQAGESLYEPDDLYEAALHSTIGSLKAARNELEVALSHYNKALEMYVANLGDQDRSIADTKIAMALVYLSLGEYEESAKVRKEAVEIYRVVVGEGKNPLFDEELIGELKGALADTLKAGGTDSLKDTESKGVHDRLIDVDEYRKGLENRTKAATDEL